MDIFRFTHRGIDDDAGVQRLVRGDGVPGEELARVVHQQDYGFSSSPPAGSHGLGLAMLGRRDRVAAIGLEHPDHRPKGLTGGAVALYDQHGKVLKFVETKTDFDGGDKDMRQRRVKKVQLDADTEYWIKPASGASIFLGQTGPWAKVMTESGPSPHVYASTSGTGPVAPTGVS